MPNTFAGFPLVDPRCVRRHRERFRRDLPKELEYANSYYSLSGRWPDVGWLLLDRASYSKIDRYSTNLQLVIQDYANPAVTISHVSIVQAQCLTRGLAADPNAIYLVQVTNMQGVLYNPWFQCPVSVQYNVRAPAYDTMYYSSTLNGASAWTWDDMVGDLWAKAPFQLGTYPHLPSAVAGTPENFVLVGVPLLEAISKVLSSIGMSVVGEYPSFSIVTPGSADSAFTALQTKYSKYLEDDMEYIDGGSGRVPGQVVVYFHRRNQYYGSEETVRRDGNQWQSSPAYSITVSAPAGFTTAAGTGYLWDSFTVRYDMDGSPLAADIVTATTIAAERVTQFFASIFRGTQGFMRQVYSGALPFSTGSLVDGVRWYNTGYRCGDYGKPDRAGWRTEIIRGYAWEETTFPTNLEGLTGPV